MRVRRAGAPESQMGMEAVKCAQLCWENKAARHWSSDSYDVLPVRVKSLQEFV